MLIEKHEREKKCRAGIPHTIRARLAAALGARGAAMGTIALAAFGLLVWKLLPLHNAAVILTAALPVWLALAVLIWRVRNPGVLPDAQRLGSGSVSRELPLTQVRP